MRGAYELDPRGSPHPRGVRARFEDRDSRGGRDWRDVKEMAESREREAREGSSAQKVEEGAHSEAPLHVLAKKILKSLEFDIVIGVVILLNAVSIGTEQTLQLSGNSTAPVMVVESIFLVIYIFELSLRLFVHGFLCFRDHWVKFDALLVGLGIFSSWIIEPFVDSMPDGLGLLMVLRIARLLRLAKMARFFAQVQEFWRLIRGLFGSLTIMAYTFVLLFIILYVFSSLGLELITKHALNMGPEPDPKFQEHVSTYFSSLPQIMCTLIQFVTLDDMHLVYKPLVEKDAFLAIYFVLVILVMSIVVVNLISAVIFSGCLEQNVYENDELQRQQEDQWAELIRELKEMFFRLDHDNSGQLSRDNMMNINPEDQEQLSEALGVSTPMDIFNALDIDRNGTISINEFFDGIWDVMLTKGDVELKRMEKQVESMHWRLKETFSLQHEARLGMNRILKQLEMDSLSELAFPPWAQALSTETQSSPLWATELNDSMKMLVKSLKAAVPGIDFKDSVHSADRARSKKGSSNFGSDERSLTPKKGRDTRDSSPRRADGPRAPDTSSCNSARDGGKSSSLFASLVRDAHGSRDRNQAEVLPSKSLSKNTSAKDVEKQLRGHGHMNGHQGELDESEFNSTDSRVHKI